MLARAWLVWAWSTAFGDKTTCCVQEVGAWREGGSRGGFQRLFFSSPRRRWQHRSAIEVTNEPILEFKPGSPERAALQKVPLRGIGIFWGSLRSQFVLLVLLGNPRLFPGGGTPRPAQPSSFPLGTVGDVTPHPHPVPHSQGTEGGLSPGLPLLVGLAGRMDGAGGGWWSSGRAAPTAPLSSSPVGARRPEGQDRGHPLRGRGRGGVDADGAVPAVGEFGGKPFLNKWKQSRGMYPAGERREGCQTDNHRGFASLFSLLTMRTRWPSTATPTR